MHNPEQAASELAVKLASKNRHVMFLLGAGSSCSAGLPDLTRLKSKVEATLVDPDRARYQELGRSRNIEEILSRLRLITEVLTNTPDELDGLDSEAARNLDKKICATISAVIKGTTTSLDAHLRFARWAARSAYVRPLEVFTTNYDTLIEQAFEEVATPYFDGFVGNERGVFRADLVDSTDGRDALTPPPGWIRLWKLHGSISWTQIGTGANLKILRGTNIGDALAVYPSLQKYEESRRLPFVVLSDRLRRGLAVPETLLVVAGYSFGDDHINELIYESAQYYSANEIVVLCFASPSNGLLRQATQISNLSVFSPQKAVIGAVEADWSAHPTDTPFWKAGKFALGAFDAFTEFLLLNVTPAVVAPLLPPGVAP